jgi:DNA polymerase elongation subunit (family B)
MEEYVNQLQEEIGFSILKNNILTQASLAEKVFFFKYYDGGLYTMPEEMSNFCQNAYKGGLCDTFKTGIFQNVISVDINSSYPYQMTKAALPTGKPMR